LLPVLGLPEHPCPLSPPCRAAPAPRLAMPGELARRLEILKWTSTTGSLHEWEGTT
jgi:hypothetical protein